MTKYNARYLPVVSRDDPYPNEPSDVTAAPSWYNDFITNLKRNSTAHSSSSIYDEISAIMGNTKSKFSNVEEVVQDMKERTGLAQLLTAREVMAAIQEPAIFQTVPELKIFIDNFVDDRPGTSVESVIHDLLKIDSIRNKLPDKSDVDNDVRIYINQRLGNSASAPSDTNKVDMHIGKVDHSVDTVSDNPLSMCEPHGSGS